MRQRLNRRTLLRGLGYGAASVGLGLPSLEAMLAPKLVRAASSPAGHPLSLFTFFVPMGVVCGPGYDNWGRDDWNPDRDLDLKGASYAAVVDYTAPRNLATIQDIRADFTVVGSLFKHEYARVSSGDAHADGHSTFATGARNVPRDDGSGKSKAGAGGPSIDWVLGKHLAADLPFPVLPVALGNASDPYLSYMTWSGALEPVDSYRDPLALFRALFGDGSADVDPLALTRQSVLDFVKTDIADLQKRLGSHDKQRMDQHLDSIRTLERQIAADASSCNAVEPTETFASVYPGDKGMSNQRAELLIDLQVKAVECGLTRFGSFQLASRANGRQFVWNADIGAYDIQDQGPGHHGISHYEPDKLTEIVEDQLQIFRYYVQKLKSVTMGDGSALFDHSLLFMAHEHMSGNSHNVDHMPVLMAGKAGGRMPLGRYIKHRQGTHYARLFPTMVELMGVDHLTLPIGDAEYTAAGPLPSLIQAT